VLNLEENAMNKNAKKKLNLNRESLVELKPDTLDIVHGGQAAGGGSWAVICISQNQRSCVTCD
jgi:hypothetical protein